MIEKCRTEADIQKANKLTQTLLKLRLAACIKLLNVHSSYWWQGDLVNSKEIQLLIKTTECQLNNLIIERTFKLFWPETFKQ